jgi:glycosyltransferase involved in cell wall biosynthesis
VVPIEANPAAFAGAVVELLTDEALWHRRRDAQINYARERFSEAAHRRSLLRALDIVPTAPVPPMESMSACAANVAMA